MELKSVGIKGIGYYIPENIMTNFDFEKIVDTSNEWIETRTGIKERRFASVEQATSALCVEAGKKALKNANLNIEDIDMIIVATSTPDYGVQSTATLVQLKLGAKQIPAFDLNAACTGFIYAFVVAEGLIKSGMYKNILVIAGDTLSKIVDMKDRNTCILFGDGAAATVIGEVRKGEGILSHYIGANGENDMILKVPIGGSKNPCTDENVKTREKFLVMKGQEVFKFAIKALPEATLKALDSAKIDSKELKMVFPHQANIRIIESAAKRLELSLDKFYVNLDRMGNTSAASIGIALGEAIEKNIIQKGDIIALTGFGAGLTYGSIILKWGY